MACTTSGLIRVVSTNRTTMSSQKLSTLCFDGTVMLPNATSFCQTFRDRPSMQSLELIEVAATDVDSLLQKTVKEVIAGHQYSNIRIKGQAHTGDAYSSDWVGGAIGAPYKYDSVEVEEGGKALVGNKYSGR
ncbi:hypothetical protein B0J14DRAFT_604255 [Halenospora varia]|nr:hypothetical protein B0J14DRAFT_604255 [Halenospora varia]